ncbi:MAG: Gmad2 immunoglobulin-like domain-containing protein [Minisyncoccia bacterium]|jgi:hypothetical protein
MKTKYYAYAAVAVILVIVAVLIYGSRQPAGNQAPAGTPTGGVFGTTAGYYKTHLETNGPVVYYSPASTTASLIKVNTPQVHTDIDSPLTISGTAVGTWYFEASFPVILTDWSGKILAQVPAEAMSDWETTSFVPFLAHLSFPRQKSGSMGVLILKKDNPSGMASKDASIEMAVTFH